MKKRRLLALIVMVCLIISTVGQNFLAVAQGEIGVRSFALSEDDSDVDVTGDETGEPANRGAKAANGKGLVKKITTSDGSTYDIEVSYKADAGIPMEGTELLVSEICPGDDGYDFYVDESTKKVGTDAENVSLTRVFDITIVDAEDHEHVYEPDGNVSVSIRLVGSDLENLENVDVLHFEEKEDEKKQDADTFSTDAFNVDAVESTVNGESVEFSTDSFSVYVIIGHEGGENVETPRFTIHFIAPVTDDSQESVVNGEFRYTAAPYHFVNKAGDNQNTLIVKDNETLELIANPNNLINKFFYGWYVVGLVSESGDDITFRWTDHPKKLSFESAVDIVNNDNGTFTMTWTADGTEYTETADVNSDDYSAHIYVAPLYEDYCFVNFHELAYQVSPNGSLLTRKLVILGGDETESVLVSDIVAPSTDTIRRIFRGWQYRINDTWVSIQTIDNHNNTITKHLDVTDNINLYPYFQEGRWLYFNVGESGNGAKYVPAQFELAEFNEESGNAKIGGTLESIPGTERVGYDFGGWRVITGYEDEAKTIPIYETVTDAEGNFLSTVDITVEETYKDNNGVEHLGVAYTIQNGTLTLKYPLSKLTFFALWEEKANSEYTIVVWKQKVTDAYNASNSQKTYDYYEMAVKTGASGRTLEQLLASNSDVRPYTTLANNATANSEFWGFQYGRAEMSDEGVKGDGSTVVNVYYDRIPRKLEFRISGNSYYYHELLATDNDNDPTKYGLVNNNYVQLYWRNNAFRTSNSNNGTVYSGTIYTRDQWQTICTINALYGQNISEYFPIVGTNGVTYNQGQRWQPQNSSTYSEVLVYIDTMPNESIAFHLNTSSNTTKYIYYYIEPLPGADLTGKTTRDYNGKTFVEYKAMPANYGYFTEAEDYINIIGFSKSNDYRPQGYNNGTATNTIWGSGGASTIYCYYLRNQYSLTFDYQYPTEVDMGDKTVVKENIPYESSLDPYNYIAHDDDTENAIRPSESEIPAHYEFKGWYEDANGDTPFNFDTTMPAADKIIYGKWEPIYYNIGIDPAGGVINHINYDEPTDGRYPTFYLSGLLNPDTTDPAWVAALAAVDNDTSWVQTLMETGEGHITSHSTYFSARYGVTIGEYSLERNYVECDEDHEGTKYYYVNMQFDDGDGQILWGLHSDLRNALYLTYDELQAYYKYCKAAKAWHDTANEGYYDGTLPETFEDFMEMYVKKSNTGGYALYRKAIAGTYEFVGWYVKNEDGTISENPFNFTNPIEDAMTLQGVWRRVGNYYIGYDTIYKMDDSTIISGIIPYWTDPADLSTGKYSDGAPTNTTQQPTDIRANGVPAADDYIFRGWQIVKFMGNDEDNMAIYTPLSSTYFDAAAPFTINADYADDSGCIHLQAVYQRVAESDRRPEIANLRLKANGGYLVRADGTRIETSDSDVAITQTTGWKVGTVAEVASEQAIIFGDMQSNDAVHLYKYAVKNGTLGASFDVSNIFFKHPNNHFLIGFDEGSDYSLEGTSGTGDDLKTGEAYIPTFAADGVISVQRTDDIVLYAVWEPMVYVTFENRTTHSVTFDVTSTDSDAMSIVNEVTGIYDRVKYDGSTVTLEPGEKIKFVMPKGAGKTFSVTGTNTSTSQLLTVSSYFNGEQTGQSTAGPNRSSQAQFDLEDTFREDETGVLVYFDGVDTVFFDVNGGTWTDTRTGESYDEVIGNDDYIYVSEDGLVYQPVDFTATSVVATEPSKPVRSGKTFIGWTTDADIAQLDPTGFDLPGTDEASNITNLTVIKSSYLWNFDSEVTEGMTLYAVWGDTVYVRFHINSNNHYWTDLNTEYFVGPTNGTGNDRIYTVAVAKGDTLTLPSAPTFKNNAANRFYRWVTDTNSQNAAKEIGDISNVYAIGSAVTQTLDLYTSWINADHIDVVISKTVENEDGSELTTEQKNKDFTFTAVITTTTYTGTVTYTNRYGWTTSLSTPVTKTETQIITLKDGESSTLSLYFHSSGDTPLIANRNNSSEPATVIYQSVTITESSDPNYSIWVNGEKIDNSTVTTMRTAPTNTTYGNNNPCGWSFANGTGFYRNYRTYTLHSVPAYSNNDTVAMDFTNVHTHTDVKVSKVVEHDDYLTGNEKFDFTAAYFDRNGNPVIPAESDDYTVDGYTVSFTLKDGESVLLRGVPIGGTVTVGEAVAGFIATSTDGTTEGDETFTLTEVSPDGDDEIIFTNRRNTYDVTVTNTVLPVEYGSTTKAFLYTATLWNGDTQVVFPSTLENDSQMTITNARKDMQISLKSGESYVIAGLPGDYKLVVTQTEDPDYITESRLDPNEFAEELTVTIDQLSENAQIDFRNTLKTADYTITKHVFLEEGQELPAGTKFAFTAKLLKAITDTTPAALSADIIAMAEAAGATVNGDIIEFQLGDGDEIVLAGLPVGYFLQVQENASGYAAYVNNIRAISATEQIAQPQGNEKNTINFTNKKTHVVLTIQKVDAENLDAVPGAVFDFYRMVDGEQQTLYTMTSDEYGWLTALESGVTIQQIELENGTYYLSETTPGSGYLKLSEPITIVVNSGETDAENVVTVSGSDQAYVIVPGEEGNSVYTIVVKNKVAIPAPTGHHADASPFLLIFLLGLAVISVHWILKSRRCED